MIRRFTKIVSEEVGVGETPWRLRVALACAALLPYRSAPRIRGLILRMGGLAIGHGAHIHGSVRIFGPSAITIGNDTQISGFCRIDATAPVTIGDRVDVAPDVTILTATHVIGDHGRRASKPLNQPVTIMDGAWIGARVTILPGVTVGAGSIVAAGAVVTKDVPPDTLVAGIPAKVVKDLPDTPGR
jgi:acetyltransferase-like isoleucine patch superfamily enzyme